jgi:hypothetical protein
MGRQVDDERRPASRQVLQTKKRNFGVRYGPVSGQPGGHQHRRDTGGLCGSNLFVLSLIISSFGVRSYLHALLEQPAPPPESIKSFGVHQQSAY